MDKPLSQEYLRDLADEVALELLVAMKTRGVESVRDLARRTGLTHTYLNARLNKIGERKVIDVSDLAQVCKALGLDPVAVLANAKAQADRRQDMKDQGYVPVGAATFEMRYFGRLADEHRAEDFALRELAAEAFEREHARVSRENDATRAAINKQAREHVAQPNAMRRLRGLLEEVGVDDGAVARALNIRPVVVTKWWLEGMSRPLTNSQIETLAAASGQPVDRVRTAMLIDIGWEDEPEPAPEVARSDIDAAG